MSFSVVQFASNITTGASVTATLNTSSVSTSNVVIAIVGAYVNTQQFATFTLSDNKSGNSYVAQDPGQVVERGTAGTYFCAQAFMCRPVQGGTNFQVTASSSISGVSIAVMEVSFAGATPQLFSTGQGTGTSSPATVSNAATYGNTLLINLAVQGNVSSTPWTPGAGYTAVENVDFIAGTQFGYLVQYLANTTTNPISPSATLAGITEYAVGFVVVQRNAGSNDLLRRKRGVGYQHGDSRLCAISDACARGQRRSIRRHDPVERRRHIPAAQSRPSGSRFRAMGLGRPTYRKARSLRPQSSSAIAAAPA